MKNIDKRIDSIIKMGATEAAFANRSNAEKFAKYFKAKGYKINGMLSSGPTVENPRKRTIHAYYVMAIKPKIKARKVRLGSMRKIKAGGRTGYTRKRR